MKSRLSLGLIMMLAALVLSFIPAATITTQHAAASSTCDWAQFIADVTVPDGTSFTPGTTFKKTWRLKNIGTCTWTTSYALVFDTGDKMGGPSSVNLPSNVTPGQTVDISINLTAPASGGHYIGYWKFKNASGVLFGIGSTANKSWWVEINVTSGSGYGVAYDFSANYCSASWYSIQGSLPCPGTDGDSRGFVLKVDKPQLENGTFDTGSGLITMPQNAYNGDIHGAFPAFRVQSGDKFQSIVNCAYGATSCYVTFRLDYQIGNGPINTLWTFREKYEGLYYRANVDLSSLAGQDVKFILTVLATGSAAGDRALWSNPAIMRLGAPPPPPPPSGYKYDFGTASSPVASGYTRVTETTAYTSGGYGWTDTSGLESRDRGAPSDDLKRDFVMQSSSPRTFKVDLPNGSYSVTVTMGDHDYAHDNMIVKANGTTVLADVDAALNTFAVNTFNVTVSGGSLALEFSDGGGTDPTWVLNAVSISTAPPPPATCDRAQFIADVTVPDGTVFNPGVTFIKTWRLKNVGTCTWTTSYAMIFDTGDKMGGPDAVNLPKSVAPGQTVDMTVNLTAPSTAGSYRGYWKFRNANGIPFGIGSSGTKSWWVDIKVVGTAATPTPGTPLPSPTPISGVMYDFAANACSAAWFSSAGTLPCPGTEGDQKGFVLKVTNPQLENGTTDSRLGLLTFPQNIYNGYIQGIYPSYRVKSGDRFRSIVNCAYGATSCYVVFRLDYQTGTSPITTFWAFVEKYEGQYYQADLDLSPLVGQDIKFILTVLSTGSPTGDRALWVAPMIYNSSFAATTAPASPAATPHPTATVALTSVSISNFSFQPQTLQVKVGSTVTWANNDATSHTVTSDTGVFDSGTLTPGGSFSFTFTQAGTFAYHCNIHPNMKGTIIVVPSDPAPTATGTNTSNWNTYQNVQFGFSFKFPPGSSIASQSDNSGRVYLPITQGTNLKEKYIDVKVVEDASTCKSPASGIVSSTENVTINGTPFLKEVGSDGAAGNIYNWTAYSTAKGTDCISLTFVLHATNPGNYPTPPPTYDMTAESAVFSTIMSTFFNQ